MSFCRKKILKQNKVDLRKINYSNRIFLSLVSLSGMNYGPMFISGVAIGGCKKKGVFEPEIDIDLGAK